MDNLVGCRECDLLQRPLPPNAGAIALCARCGAHLEMPHARPPRRGLACALGAIIVLALAVPNPLVGLQFKTGLMDTTLLGAARGLYLDHWLPLAGVVFVTTIALPLLAMAAHALLVAPLRLGEGARRALLCIVRTAEPWSMLDVFLLGVVVALAKLATVATIVPGLGAFALGGAVLLWASARR